MGNSIQSFTKSLYHPIHPLNHSNLKILKNSTVSRALQSWELSSLGLNFPQNGIPSEQMLQAANSLKIYLNVCVEDSDAPGHSKYPHTITNFATEPNNLIRGTTFWINEHQAVGHAEYDIILLQLLYSSNISRVVLQRAPCSTPDLCRGIGTWESFYKVNLYLYICVYLYLHAHT